MKKDIKLSGVGGQGILSIATVIGEAATEAGLQLKQAEVHGMSQRGGDVQSDLRLSTEEIFSDQIGLGKADLIISMEPSLWRHSAISLISAATDGLCRHPSRLSTSPTIRRSRN